MGGVAEHATEVAVTNLTPTFYTTLVCAIGLLGVMARQWVPLKRIKVDADARLIDTLSERVAMLEKKLEEERARHEGGIAAFDKKLDDERGRHEREVSLLRHRANNSDQCLDAFILLLENADDLPDRVKRAIASVREMRTRQRSEEALEKGAMKAGGFATSAAAATQT